MNITIKRGNVKEMLELWNGRYECFIDDYVKDIEAGNHEVWLMKDEDINSFIGEIHIVWDSKDKDQANGIDTAYIMSFEIEPTYQGKQLGSALMRRALQRIKEYGYTKATIGADDLDSEKLCAMYKAWGFIKEIKRDFFEYIEDGQTLTCTYSLLLNDEL